MKELNVGDVIYRYEYGTLTEKKKIDRLTAKRAFSGGNQFKIEYENTILTEVGRGEYCHHSFYISTPENYAKWERQRLLKEARAAVNDLNKHSSDTLTKLIELLS